MFLRFHVPVILASGSPRRKALLERLGVPLTVIPSGAPEHILPGESPSSMVARLALDKVREVASSHPESLVIGADTVVVLGDEVLGKPSDPAEARAMLRRLSGCTHAVYTGIAASFEDRESADYTRTAVTFGELSDAEIARYVDGGSPMDKAGAYGIQDDAGSLFVERIDGDYYNVVGLPLRSLYRLLASKFSDLLVS
ncbi:MAG: septum formation protein Maf [Rhodothermales bacterium]|nr:septum formation protein Maf [Rhodothermales bacterium]MBO6779737.1 septum formation protein Maf [Rhodothermales bacterium]